MVKPITSQLASSLLGLDEVLFKVILESRIKWRGFSDKTIDKWQQALFLHLRQKAVTLLCNNSGEVAIRKSSSPALPMVSQSNTVSLSNTSLSV